MALSKPIETGLGVNADYHMVSGVVVDARNRTAHVHVASYVNEAVRDAEKAALARKIDAEIMGDAEAAQETLPAIRANQSLPPVAYRMSPREYRAAVDGDGSLTLPAIYGWLKTLPKFDGATDC